MPVYEYRCGDCGATFERLSRTVTAAEPVACAGCGGRAERQMSPFAYHPSLKTQVESIDPAIEKELDHAYAQNDPGPLPRMNLDFDRELPPAT